MLALPPAHPPPPAVAGVRIVWPATTTVAPGTKLVVTVRSTRRRTQLSLVRVDAHGTATSAVARRTLRSGKFSAAPPAVGTYALRAVIAGHRYSSWVVATSTPAPSPPSPWQAQGCPLSSTPETLQLGATTARAGDVVSFTRSSPGGSCLSGGVCPTFQEQQADGSWRVVDVRPCPMIALSRYDPPGTSRADAFTVPAGATPGTYRYTDGLRYWLPDGTTHAITAIFTVTA